MSSHWSKRLISFGVPEEIVEWAQAQPDFATAWRECKRGDWMLLLIAHIDQFLDVDRLPVRANAFADAVHDAVLETDTAHTMTRNEWLARLAEIVRQHFSNFELPKEKVIDDGLREALKKANFECVSMVGMFSEEFDIFERHIRWWHGPIIDELEDEITSLRIKIAEYEELMNLQHERTAEADRLWQKENGKENVLPDLGTLIEWLMKRADRRTVNS
jgi:hypothetical protein